MYFINIWVAPYVGAWIETAKAGMIVPVKAVAPYVGAWIETRMPPRKPPASLRRTLCGCVDWNILREQGTGNLSVAPYVGAWIETERLWINVGELDVAPYVGAWIETSSSSS